ncbi:hypothetical protein A2160_02115 [Candidatus Beckwithbacteria bacterium RBG_13_42_9]|uniref:Cytochrome b561 domain-containing protein n=1 Tax=Candidatus Beckwithbacteria bacterium RBG_13_42_9 TaxID=1797457 RepID=A0A1F5E791_9BACT|nr:MAG: hypothetical protein A2160_02115 [Candidatus Beckwithbacteria bacterium RBG_13_42_9]
MMLLSDPIILAKPLHIWLGFIALMLLIVQILIGTRIVKLPFWFHTQIVWKILLIVVLLHALYGFKLYFLS